MTRPRKRPTLTAPLGPDGRKALADRVQQINQRGQEARQKLADTTGRKPGRAPVGRIVQQARGIARQLENAEARVEQLAARGAYAEADRVGRTVLELRRKLRSAEAADRKAKERRGALDRFARLVSRSAVLDDWHMAVADRWLFMIGQAVDGLMQRAAEPDASATDAEPGQRRDPVTGRRLPDPVEGPAMFVRGRSVLDRWGHAVPVSAVKQHGRKVPPTFDPKAPKPAKRAPGDGVPDRALRTRDHADRLTRAFAKGVAGAGHPAWADSAGQRVILGNETLTGALKALGVGVTSKNLQTAQTAMAAGLCEVARALGMGLPDGGALTDQ